MIDPALISTERLVSDLDQLLGLPGSPGEAEELSIVAELTGQKKNRSFSYAAYVELLAR